MKKAIFLALILAVTPSASAVRLVQWGRSLCNGTTSKTQLIRAGIRTSCEIWIHYVPDTVNIARADLTYKLLYHDVVNDQTIVKTKFLSDREWIFGDHRSPHGLSYRQRYPNTGITELRLTFPTSINARSNLKYVALGVTVDIIFTDGTKKKIYEKFPIEYR